jgi:hypothetical protein
MTSAALLKLLERATKRFQNFRGIGEQAAAMKSDVVLHPLEWWEPEDEALLKEMTQAINQNRGCEPLPLEAAATADDDEEASNE